jgi:hypothetical protein
MKGVSETPEAKPSDAAHTVTPVPAPGDSLKPPPAV